MRIKYNQSGFGAIELVIIILVIGILGGVGWIVYAHHKSSTATVSQNKTTTSTDVAKKNKLYISEWGVSLPYSGDITLTYGSGSTKDSMFLSSTELTTANSKCSANMGGVGSLMRAKVGDVAHFSGHDAAVDVNLTGQQYADKYPNETSVLGGYAYTTFIRSDDACAGDPSASPTVKAINSLFQ